MRSSSETLLEFYKAVTTLLPNDFVTGRIFKGNKPLGRQSEDIELNVLSNSGRSYVNEGYLNMNLYVMSLADGTPDVERFLALGQVITATLQKIVNGDYRFQIESESGILRDEDQDKLHFVNYKFNYQTI